MEIDNKLLLAVIPLVIIQIILIIVCLKDWYNRIHFRVFNRWVWFVVIIFVNIIGPIIYLTMGRGYDND